MDDWTLKISYLSLVMPILCLCVRSTQQASIRFSILRGQDELDLFNRMQDYDHTHALAGAIEGLKTLTLTIGRPLEFLANVDYTLVLQADMAACFAGTDGQACVTCDDASFRFRDARVKMNGTTVSEGQIPALVYSVR